VPLLARHYRVIRRDMRGHGQSADPGLNHAWPAEELLTDIKGFLDALNLDRVHYVGESMPAWYAGPNALRVSLYVLERLKFLHPSSGTLPLAMPTGIPRSARSEPGDGQKP
jgi:pimeloyl-ACP methyl ester carboxylesterase